MREREFYKEMAIEGVAHYWKLSFPKDDLFRETSTRSLYMLNNVSETVDKKNVLADDDKGIYTRFLELAVADLTKILMRRIVDYSLEDCCHMRARLCREFGYRGPDFLYDKGIINNDDKLEYHLLMGENHDRNTLSILWQNCKEYLILRILELWFNKELGSAQQETKIVSALEYRKHSSARRVRPLL